MSRISSHICALAPRLYILTLEFVIMLYGPLKQSKKMFSRKLLRSALATALLALFCWTGTARAGTELLMVEQTGCEWCAAWNAEIGGIYHLTDHGKRAPLRRQDLFDPWPEDISLRMQVHFTPTFVLLVDGKEAGRIEGYPGEHFFWPMLAQLLGRTTSGKNKQEGNDS